MVHSILFQPMKHIDLILEQCEDPVNPMILRLSNLSLPVVLSIFLKCSVSTLICNHCYLYIIVVFYILVTRVKHFLSLFLTSFAFFSCSYFSNFKLRVIEVGNT